MKANQPFMTVQLLGSGWAAVLMHINIEEKDLGPFPEPWDTGIGRYATREEAVREAQYWANDEGVPMHKSLIGEIEYISWLPTAVCSLCSRVPADGFYTGCMCQDLGPQNGYICDDQGLLTKIDGTSL